MERNGREEDELLHVFWEVYGVYGDLWGFMGVYGDLWGFMGVYGGLWGFRDFQGTSVSAALLLHQETCQLLLLPACQVAALLQSSLPATACPLTPVLHLKPCYGLAAKP